MDAIHRALAELMVDESKDSVVAVEIGTAGAGIGGDILKEPTVLEGKVRFRVVVERVR